MAVTAAFLDYAVDLFAPWAPVQAKRMFGGAGLMRDGRMFALVDGDQIYLKVNPETRAAFEAQGCSPFVFVSKAGEEIQMSYWSMPAEAFDDPGHLRAWADRAWSAAAGPAKKAKPAPRRALAAKDPAALPLQSTGKGAKALKKRSSDRGLRLSPLAAHVLMRSRT